MNNPVTSAILDRPGYFGHLELVPKDALVHNSDGADRRA